MGRGKLWRKKLAKKIFGTKQGKIQTMKRNQSFIEKDGIKPIAYAHLLDEKADPFQSDKPRWYWLMNLSAERGV